MDPAQFQLRLLHGAQFVVGQAGILARRQTRREQHQAQPCAWNSFNRHAPRLANRALTGNSGRGIPIFRDGRSPVAARIGLPANLCVWALPRWASCAFPPFVSFVAFCLALKGLQKQTKATKKKSPRRRILSCASHQHYPGTKIALARTEIWRYHSKNERYRGHPIGFGAGSQPASLGTGLERPVAGIVHRSGCLAGGDCPI
jgi:hypothetical protein